MLLNNKELQLKQILFTILLISFILDWKNPQLSPISANITNKFLTVEEQKERSLLYLLSIFQKQVRRFQETKYLEEAVPQCTL